MVTARWTVVVVILAMAAIVWGQKTPAAKPATAPPPAAKTEGVQIWISDVIRDEPNGTMAGGLTPVTLVGARNGTFSGVIVIQSSSKISDVQVAVGPLSGAGGTVPAANVQLRYAARPEAQGHAPRGYDYLQETPPAEVAPYRGSALLPVWVTVRVPKDAKAGTYSAQVTLRASGAAAVKVPVSLEVEDWTLPDPQDYRTWTDFIESPDTLALQYNVPLWSDAHWKLIERSFQMLSPSGSRTLYVPLICRTNLGNEQSMVRWIKKGQNQYEYDFTVFDRYLDAAQKNLGQPKLIVLQVWDVVQSLQSLNRSIDSFRPDGGQAVKEGREELLGKGPRVTVLDPVTKEPSILILPRYEDAASKALWQPLFTEIRQRLAKRGLEKAMILGLMSDLLPNKDEVTFWKEISGGLPWAIHSHGAMPLQAIGPGRLGLYKIADVCYAAYVGLVEFNVNPEKGRDYGWRNPALFTAYLRGGAQNWASHLDAREFQVFNITGGQRGGGRMGGDLWQVIRNKKGEPSQSVYDRYPENNWRNLDIHDWFLAPGPNGAIATARLECLKEGIQECEARILLEDTLLDQAKKARIGPDLAQRCQAALDEHHRAMWKTVWNVETDLQALDKISSLGRSPAEGLWAALKRNKKDLPDFFTGPALALRRDAARQGEEWFDQGWQEREKKLFVLAGEVTAKLGMK